jgi:predicted TIM-barrel fold metal-dependent hydrolase
MYKGLKVIDADAHMQEPPDVWDKYVEPKFYDRRPIVKEVEYRLFFKYEPGELYPQALGGKDQMGRLRPKEILARQPIKYGEAYEEYWSAESRLRDMQKFGWDKMVLIPGTGAQPIKLENKDPELMFALARAYHNWCHDFCAADPSRLKMVAQIPSYGIEDMIKEMRRAVTDLGAVTVMAFKPQEGKFWHDPYYDVFWNTAEELDVPVAFHGVQSSSPHTGKRYQGIPGTLIALEHAIGFPFENMISLGHMIYTGILEKHPDLRIAMLEGNAGWVPFWMGRLDDHMHGRQAVFITQDQNPMTMKPSEYFKRQVWVACDGDEFAVPAVVSLMGADNLLWNTDYPHPDAPDPDKALPEFMEQPISMEAKKKVLWDSPVRLFGQRIVN